MTCTCSVQRFYSEDGKRVDMEHSGSVVVCLTQDQEAAGSSLNGVTAFWSLSKTHLF